MVDVYLGERIIGKNRCRAVSTDTIGLPVEISGVSITESSFSVVIGTDNGQIRWVVVTGIFGLATYTGMLSAAISRHCTGKVEIAPARTSGINFGRKTVPTVAFSIREQLNRPTSSLRVTTEPLPNFFRTPRRKTSGVREN